MKKLLTVAAVTAAFALSSLTLYAQGMGGCGGPGEGMGPGMGFLFMMEKELNLTDDQMDKIHKADMEFRDRQYQNMRDHRKAIDKILTDDQKKKLDDLRKKGPARDGKRDGKGKYHDKEGKRGFMQPGLDLTDDQVDKIHKINMDYADKFHKNRKNADELKKLRESRDKEIEKVLTKEQLEKIKEFRKKSGRDCPYFPD
jgi:Spy/CpxP family protein refolding chaperone